MCKTFMMSITYMWPTWPFAFYKKLKHKQQKHDSNANTFIEII